jgi:hypothetical protein
LCQRPSEGRDLVGLLALVAGERAGERVQEQVLAMIPDAVGQIVVPQCGGELRQRLRCFFRHHDLPFNGTYRYALDPSYITSSALKSQGTFTGPPHRFDRPAKCRMVTFEIRIGP